ncbi:MAG: hypothetical protein CMD31_00185 [Flavobacteriales bacterium]|nr:hypothetical protein [Flavobacteriales bacterium]
MRLHDKLSVSDNKLKSLRRMSEKNLRKWISQQNLFGGYPKKYVEQQEDLLYGKIVNGEPKVKAEKADKADTQKGDRDDNPKGQGDRKEKKGGA